MPDVERRLADLRDEIRAVLPVPDLGTVAERYRQRRTRRRMQLGAVAAVLAVSAVVPLLRQLDVEPSTAAPPTAVDRPISMGVSEVQFAADGSGYALRARCAVNAGAARKPACALTLLVTEDLENWAAAGSVPVPEGTDFSPLGQLSVLGPGELVVDWPSVVEPASSRSVRVHSEDGGRTWQHVRMPDVVTDVVAAIPQDAQLLPACGAVHGSQACDTPTFTVVRPGSGAPAVLANPPPLWTPVPGAIPTADGHWWVIGYLTGTEERALSVSTDDGRTWTTSRLNVDLPQDVSAVVVSHGDVLYAALRGFDPRGGYGLLAILRSGDGGRTWQQTWKPTAGQRIVQYNGGLVAAADGSLVIVEYPRVYTSTDGGRTLELSTQQRVGLTRWTRAGYLALGADSFELSSDGIHWREYDLPPPG